MIEIGAFFAETKRSAVVCGACGYGPFGELLRATGPACRANPFRFSTKYQDDETDLLYYGYRYYTASTGRWLSRDPLTERRPGDSYCFVKNSPITHIDCLGLIGIPTCGYGCVEPPGGDPCSLSYTFDDDDPWWEKPMYPIGTAYVQSMQQVKEHITAKMKRCCCIRSIFITAHNGMPGTLMLGDGQVTPGIQKQIQDAADEAKRRILEQSIQREREFLQFISDKMCKNGKVTFVQCSAGSGPEGDALNKWLQQIFGPSIDVTLFSGDVRWSWGTPKCTQK